MEHDEGLSPTLVVARRVRELRERRGLTAQALADKLAEQGVPWERSTVAKLENGKRQNLTLTEWLALAVVLNVAPVHLLLPTYPSPGWDRQGGERNDPNDDAYFQVTPRKLAPVSRVRDFIRGQTPLPGEDARMFYAEAPAHEFAELMGQAAVKDRLAYMHVLDATGFNPDGTRKQGIDDE